MTIRNIDRRGLARAAANAAVLALSAACSAGSPEASAESRPVASESAVLARTSPGEVPGIATGSEFQPDAPAALAGDPTTIKVYKDANCGCCNKWVEHLASNGFKVETMDMPDLSLLKQKHGVTAELQSCHTAIVDGYVVEGHVPADVIRKMLKERPSIAGLAVPGMPIGSPGMEGGTKERYDVLTFDRAGRTTIYSRQ
ncbi:MAG: DUF411 domain-containing protein [Gemmatimonadaceae bacterium]